MERFAEIVKCIYLAVTYFHKTLRLRYCDRVLNHQLASLPAQNSGQENFFKNVHFLLFAETVISNSSS